MPGRIKRVNFLYSSNQAYPVAVDGAYGQFDSSKMIDPTTAQISRVWQGPGAISMTASRENPNVQQAIGDMIDFGYDTAVRYLVYTDTLIGSTFQILSGIGTINKFSGVDELDRSKLTSLSGLDDYWGAEDWVTQDTQVFTDKTAGWILAFYRNQAQNDPSGNLMPGVNWESGDFNSAHDTLGQPWSSTISVSIGPGLTYTQILQGLNELQMINFKLASGFLSVYNWIPDPVDSGVRMPAKMLQESPLSGDVSGMRDRIVYQGKPTTDPAWNGRQIVFPVNGLGNRRPRSGYVSQGNIDNASELTLYIHNHQAEESAPAIQKTVKYLASGDPVPLPGIDFELGEAVFLPGNSRGFRRIGSLLRVLQYVIDFQDDGEVYITLTMGSILEEAQDKLVGAVNGITGGATQTGMSTIKRI